jgi:diguanylate cyclase (GGDEF)-like protein
VLQEVAVCFQTAIRDVDLACRWGGEEILFLITRAELDEIILVTSRLCINIRQLAIQNNGEKI